MNTAISADIILQATLCLKRQLFIQIDDEIYKFHFFFNFDSSDEKKTL